MRKSWKSGKFYPHVQPAPKSVRKIKQAVKEVTGRTYTSITMEDVIMLVNRKVRGWTNYFHHKMKKEYRKWATLFQVLIIHHEFLAHPIKD